MKVHYASDGLVSGRAPLTPLSNPRVSGRTVAPNDPGPPRGRPESLIVARAILPRLLSLPPSPHLVPSTGTSSADTSTFQGLLGALSDYWSCRGCVLLQALRHGSGRRHLSSRHFPARDRPRAVGGRAPAILATTEGRSLRRQPQPLAALLPVPGRDEALATGRAGHLPRLRFPTSAWIPLVHDIRFVEDNWESPTLGAWGLGWEVWLNGMEITQFTYFQQVGGLECRPVTAEIAYGAERIAMYLQNVDNIFDLVWARRTRSARCVTETYLRAERARDVGLQLRARRCRCALRALRHASSGSAAGSARSSSTKTHPI